MYKLLIWTITLICILGFDSAQSDKIEWTDWRAGWTSFRNDIILDARNSLIESLMDEDFKNRKKYTEYELKKISDIPSAWTGTHKPLIIS